MVPRNMIQRMLLTFLLILALSMGVQAQKLKEVNANDILKQIENGEDIYINDVSIIGELNLSRIRVKTVPFERKSVGIIFADFNEVLSLEHELKIIESKIYIENSVFKDNVDFSNAQFKYLYFINTNFSSNADFKGDFFNDVAFVGSSFNGTTYFWNANFSGDAAYFENVAFRGFTFFQDSNFNGYSNFRYANFSGFTVFGDASFNGDTNFEETRFSDVTFKGARFNGAAYFVNANFSGDAHFVDASFKSDGKFYGTKFNKVNFEGANFDNVEISWSSLINALIYDGGTYVKLIKHFRDVEQFDDADNAYYEYRLHRQEIKIANKDYISWLWDAIWWITIGYGVKPGYPIFWIAAIIVFCAFYYYSMGESIRTKYNLGNEFISASRNEAIFNAFIFSIAAFLTIEYGDWKPVGRYRWLVVLEGFFGWFFLSLFIITLVNVTIRP